MGMRYLKLLGELRRALPSQITPAQLLYLICRQLGVVLCCCLLGRDRTPGVLPRETAGDVHDGALGHTKLLGNRTELLARRPSLTNRDHLKLSELGERIPLAFGRLETAAVNRILNIVSLGSQNKMIWVYTGSLITPMSYNHPGRNGATDDLPRVAVCVDLAIYTALSEAETTIPGMVTHPPQPTRRPQHRVDRALLIYPPPEAISSGLFHHLSITHSTLVRRRPRPTH